MPAARQSVPSLAARFCRCLMGHLPDGSPYFGVRPYLTGFAKHS